MANIERHPVQFSGMSQVGSMQQLPADNSLVAIESVQKSIQKVKVSDLLAPADKELVKNKRLVALLVQEVEGQEPILRSIHAHVWETAKLVRNEARQVVGTRFINGG